MLAVILHDILLNISAATINISSMTLSSDISPPPRLPLLNGYPSPVAHGNRRMECDYVTGALTCPDCLTLQQQQEPRTAQILELFFFLHFFSPPCANCHEQLTCCAHHDFSNNDIFCYEWMTFSMNIVSVSLLSYCHVLLYSICAWISLLTCLPVLFYVFFHVFTVGVANQLCSLFVFFQQKLVSVDPTLIPVFHFFAPCLAWSCICDAPLSWSTLMPSSDSRHSGCRVLGIFSVAPDKLKKFLHFAESSESLSEAMVTSFLQGYIWWVFWYAIFTHCCDRMCSPYRA